MKVLVTGGAGFIGSYVAAAHLRAGHHVVVVDDLSSGREENIPEGATFERIDITSDALDALMDRERFDIVNHHAAHMELRVSVERPLHDAEVNLLGSLRLLEASRRNAVQHVVLASTGGAIYGEQDYYPADESHPVRPMSPYAISKRSMELYADYYRSVHGLSSTVLRYTNVYGPRQNPYGEAGVIAIFLNKWLTGEVPVVNGDGTQTRDYVHAEDVAHANMLAATHRLQGIYNCSTGIETSLNDLIAMLQADLGSVRQLSHGPAKLGELPRSSATAARLQAATGWTPAYALRDGIRQTTAWFVDRLTSNET
ncbi:MAG: NAD-dependent epimerase/dehydratase family protein [Candidatus Kapabacteria bacterium]|nr:NAD-dependent epimerase/dehydratase family protein [Candidatus Kapabacteria bacterium]